jgi:hypothetical protein
MLQKGQVVVVEPIGSAHSSIYGQQGELVYKDVATGRYRVRLCSEPWRCVKVNRSEIRALDPTEEQSSGIQVGQQQFGASLSISSKSERMSVSFKRAQPRALPPELQTIVKKTSQTSAMMEGALQDHKTPSSDDRWGMPTYRELQQMTHSKSTDPQQVQRQRHYFYPSLQDQDFDLITFLPKRPVPVQRGRPHRILPLLDSEYFKAMVEDDIQNHFCRKVKIELSNFGSTILTDAPRLKVNQRREEEMDERLKCIEQRIASARKERAATQAAFEALDKLESGHYEEESPTVHVEQKADAFQQDPQEQEESEEQRIEKEFKEYEIESLSHSGSVPTTPYKRDLWQSAYADEGFEEDEDAEKDRSEQQGAEIMSLGEGDKAARVFKNGSMGLGFYQDAKTDEQTMPGSSDLL